MRHDRTGVSRRIFLKGSALAATGVLAGPAMTGRVLAAQSAATATPKPGGTLNYAEPGDFQSFNPWTFQASDNSAYNQVFSRLFWKDGAGKIHPDLATEWSQAKDGKSFTVKLKSGSTWHDGSPVTAKDFVTMYGYLSDAAYKDAPSVQKMKALFVPITGVDAPDDQTVVFTSSEPVPYITDIIDYFFLIKITPTNYKLTNPLPVGTGPFQLTAWKPAQYVTLKKFAGYHASGLPYLDEIMFQRIARAETMLPNLQSGATDGILVTSLSDVATIKQNNQLRLDINDSAGSIFNINVNVLKPPLDKQEVRQALSYSLDRAAMVKSAFFGVSSPTSTAFYSPATIAYIPAEVNAYPFDLDKAKSLLKSNGISKLNLTIVTTPAWPQMKLFSLIWQSDLAKIGVNLKVNEVETAQFYDVGNDKHLLGNDLLAWLNGRTTRDPAVFWNTQNNYRGGSTNTYGYSNPQMEKLVAQGAVETDPAKRKQIYQQLNTISTEACNVINVATNPRIWSFNKSVEGVHYDLNGNVWFDTAWLNR